MPISKAKKSEIYENIAGVVKDASSVVFVNFHKVAVSDITAFRRALKAQGVNYLVTKKSLAKKALTEKNIEGTMPSLDGELGLAYSADQLAPAREVFAFQKKLDNRIAILGGVFDGMYKSKEEMTVIANIPSREVLLSQIAYLLKSPLTRLAVAVSEVAKTKN